jgi:hypothetical protein
VLQPTGPLPSTVYWRRRAAALAGLVTVLVLLIWLVTALIIGSDDDTANLAGSERPVQPAAQQLTATPEPTITTSSRVPPPPEASDTPSPTPPPAPPPGVAPSTAASPGVAPSGVALSGGALSTAAPATAALAPQPCADGAMALTAQPERPEYRVGAKPVFRLTVTNTGPTACTRDLDAGLQELLVYASDGTTRLWSSNDCYPGSGADVRTLQPAEVVTFTVTWAGRSSRPHCAGQRVPIPPGDYLVLAQLGPLSSPPTPFKLTR